jgi:hypothetical protein
LDAERPRYLDDILDADASRILHEAVYSEEGGRFLNAQSRYMFVCADDRAAAQGPPPGFCWINIGRSRTERSASFARSGAEFAAPRRSDGDIRLRPGLGSGALWDTGVYPLRAAFHFSRWYRVGAWHHADGKCPAD